MTPRDKVRTVWFAGVLHAFTHMYQVALLPLYLLIQEDLHLANLRDAPLLMTILGLAYYLPSYPMGMLADRWNRKKLLAIGLALNGAGFVALAYAPSYATAVAAVIVAGIGGSFYHPSATALVARLFPLGTGKALGFVGIGASVGFFIAPLYSGWRAMTAGSWRTPVLELGLAGIVVAVLFAWLAKDETARIPDRLAPRNTGAIFGSPILWLFFFAACLAFSLRDFAGGGVATLSSLFLQHAHDATPKATGLALSGMFLASAISNPLFGHLSDRGRLRWTSLVLACAAFLVVLLPRVSREWHMPVLALYGFFFMSSFPMVEAALMESVHDSVRGRVFGLFITVGGFVGTFAHWKVGDWVSALGAASQTVSAYFNLFAVLALLILLSVAGLPCLFAIRKRDLPAPTVEQSKLAGTGLDNAQSALE